MHKFTQSAAEEFRKMDTTVTLTPDQQDLRAAVIRECIEEISSAWRHMPNVRTDSVLTSYQQNACGAGIVAACKTLESLLTEKGAKL